MSMASPRVLLPLGVLLALLGLTPTKGSAAVFEQTCGEGQPKECATCNVGSGGNHWFSQNCCQPGAYMCYNVYPGWHGEFDPHLDGCSAEHNICTAN